MPLGEGVVLQMALPIFDDVPNPFTGTDEGMERWLQGLWFFLLLFFFPYWFGGCFRFHLLVLLGFLLRRVIACCNCC